MPQQIRLSFTMHVSGLWIRELVRLSDDRSLQPLLNAGRRVAFALVLTLLELQAAVVLFVGLHYGIRRNLGVIALL